MSFGAPEWLWALLVLPVLIFLFVTGERRSATRLKEFVAPKLLPALGGTVNRPRRLLRFALVLLGVGCAILALAKPRYGYTYEEVKRRGLDLILAVDTSRSMLANDVPPNRLARVKLAAQDLINELRGDRVGLIAFAGRAFLQAPLTIDYQAAVEALNELDTEIIPEGGTNLSAALQLAIQTYGKSAIGNRALIIFTDGEELAGDAIQVAKEAAEAGVKVFAIGVGTPEGSLIPLNSRDGRNTFVKDPSGQVVKSKLDEGRLREIAQQTGGFYLPLTSGPSTMRQLYEQGLAQMQAGEIDTRMSRQPIERYQWPLGLAILTLAASLLVSERKRKRAAPPVAAVYDRRNGQGKSPLSKNGSHRPPLQKRATILALVVLVAPLLGAQAAAPGLDAYRQGDYAKAYEQFQQTLREHPNARATDRIQFDAGAAAYKMKDYGKALQAFSQALLSKDTSLQQRSHYNLGNTLYQRGEAQQAPQEKLQDWADAVRHYDETLRIDPDDKQAQENRDYVLKKIEELKKEQEQQPPPTPTPSPSPNQKQDQQKQQDQKQDQQQQQQQQQDQSSQSQDQQKDQSGEKQEQQDQPQGPSPSPSPAPGASPSSSPSGSPDAGASPSPSPGEADPSPTPGQEGEASPSPSPGEGEGQDGEGASPTPGPSPSATPKLEGEVRGADGEQPSPESREAQAMAETEQPPEGEMTPQQAERLLQAMKDEEARVQLDERRRVRRVYKDW